MANEDINMQAAQSKNVKSVPAEVAGAPAEEISHAAVQDEFSGHGGSYVVHHETQTRKQNK